MSPSAPALAPAEGVDPDRHYEIAQRALDLSSERDGRAASMLAGLLADRDGPLLDPESLRERFEGAEAVVVGPVPGTAEKVDPSKPIVAAGSAVRQCLSAGIQPALVASDLDGDDTAHDVFSGAGVPIAVHAHADNTGLLNQLVPTLRGPLFGTCQTPPPEDAPITLHRVGGFTDGDRACFLAAALGAARLRLVGFDLEEPVEGGLAKKRKLELAGRLLEDVPIPVEIVDPGDPRERWQREHEQQTGGSDEPAGWGDPDDSGGPRFGGRF